MPWILLVCATAWLASPPLAAQESQPLPEAAVISAYLTNFLHFIEWPDGAYESPSSPHQLCILADDELAATLEAMTDGKERQGRPMQVQSRDTLDDIAVCHVVYLDPASWAKWQGDFDALRTLPILTVGRSRDFLEGGGAINLRVVRNRLLFEVDRDALEASGLTADSRLLATAHQVRQGKRRRKKP